MKFTKANLTFAKKHNIDLDIDYDRGLVQLALKGEEEPVIVYNLNTEKDELFFKVQCYGEKIEDLPYWINTSKGLNELVKYISKIENI